MIVEKAYSGFGMSIFFYHVPIITYFVYVLNMSILKYN